MKHSITQSDVSRDPHPTAPPAALAHLWSRTSKLRELACVVQAIEAWPGVTIVPDRQGLCLMHLGVMLGHLRWDGRLDLPFAPEVADRLVAERMAGRDPGRDGVGSVVFDVQTIADANHAAWLLRLAYLSVHSKVDVSPRSSMRL
jgi:hypothetical protein